MNKKVSTLYKIATQQIEKDNKKVLSEIEKNADAHVTYKNSISFMFDIYVSIIDQQILGSAMLSYRKIMIACQQNSIRLTKKEHKKLKYEFINAYQESISRCYNYIKNGRKYSSILATGLPSFIEEGFEIDLKENDFKERLKEEVTEIMDFDRNLFELKKFTLGERMNFWMTIVGALGFLLALAAFIIELCSTGS